jgi:hypothetical protein
MAPIDPTPPRARAARAKWVVGTSAVAATLLLTGVVAAQGSADDDPTSDETTSTPAGPSPWLPPSAPAVGGPGDWWPGDHAFGDDEADGGDDWSTDDGGSLVPTAPSGSADTSSHGS